MVVFVLLCCTFVFVFVPCVYIFIFIGIFVCVCCVCVFTCIVFCFALVFVVVFFIVSTMQKRAFIPFILFHPFSLKALFIISLCSTDGLSPATVFAMMHAGRRVAEQLLDAMDALLENDGAVVKHSSRGFLN